LPEERYKYTPIVLICYKKKKQSLFICKKCERAIILQSVNNHLIFKDIMSKRVKGSMLIMDDGSSMFTPYNNNPLENTPYSVKYRTENGVLRMTKNSVEIKITVNRNLTLKEAQSIFLNQFSKLLGELKIRDLNKQKQM